MTSTGQVSVALASFNGERYIAEQLRSILGQTRPPDEIVISDGGSQDDTIRVAQEVLDGAPRRIRVEIIADGARLGVTDNFARAIAATRGGFIALSDQDDRWLPDRLARGVGLMELPGVLLSAGNARLVAGDGSPLGIDLFTALGIGTDEVTELDGAGAFALLLRRNLVTGATVMFRRELLDAATPFPAEWVHDEWLAILAAALGRVAVDSSPLIDYRQHGRNEIGVTAPTLRSRTRRMLEPRGDRYRVLARRSEELAERLSTLGAPVDRRELAARKAAFESVRAGYAARRLGRVRPVLMGLRAGSYRDLSSQGTLDVARDLLQPE
jgi:glycosyltransferase involved in cell wall biosynthesis